jgi:hypothetical protein
MQEYFQQSYIIECILKKRATKNDTSCNLDIEKLKQIFTSMFKITTSSSILELYMNLLFEPNEEINYESKKKINMLFFLL